MTNKIDFRVLIVSFGLILFLFAPGSLFWNYTLLATYPSDITYPLWAPGINYFDIYWLVCTCLILISGLPKKIGFNFYVFSVMAFWLVVWSFILITVNGFDVSVYHDGFLMTYRIVILYFIFSFCARQNKLYFLITTVSFCVVVLVLISLGAVVIMGYEGVIGGRINLLGMGPNVSGDTVAIVFGLLVFLRKEMNLSRPVFYISLLILSVYLPFTGSRRILFYWFLLLFFYCFHVGAMRRFLIVVALFFMVLASFGYMFFAESFSDSSLISIVRLFDTVEQIRTGGFVDGRSGMYQTALAVIDSFPFGLGGSDWLIQTEMQKIGVGSHTHNVFLQFYLKVGPLLLIPVVAVIWFFSKNNLRGVGYIWVIVFIQNMTGHGLWNQKYLLVIVFLVVISLRQIVNSENKFSR